MCEISIIYPTRLSNNIATPTLPTINIGPEFEQKVKHLTAWVFVSFPLLYKSATNLLPTGYPVRILIKKI